MPTLVLAGNTSVHSPREDADALAARLPAARRVEVSGMDHIPGIVEPCVAAMVGRFVRRLNLGNTSCPADPGGPWLAPGRFPRTAAGAFPARVDPGAGNAAGPRGRRVAAVAVATVVDALYHGDPAVPRTRGLRGGSSSIRVSRDQTRLTITLNGARFTRDVAVRGAVRLDRDQRFSGRLSVRGRGVGRRGATLSVIGRLGVIRERPARVRGRIGGRRAALLVDIY